MFDFSSLENLPTIVAALLFVFFVLSPIFGVFVFFVVRKSLPGINALTAMIFSLWLFLWAGYFVTMVTVLPPDSIPLIMLAGFALMLSSLTTLLIVLAVRNRFKATAPPSNQYEFAVFGESKRDRKNKRLHKKR